ncbi:CHIP family protein [Megaselia abdita]
MNTKSYTYSTANLTDTELKEQGNNYFTTKNFEDAIHCYSKAITKNPNNPVYFTNRALCYLKLKQWNEAAKDCRSALEIDNSVVKAHFFLGQCLIELEQFDDAIAYLQRAHDISKAQKQNFGDDIAAQIRFARKKRWSELEEKRILQESKFQSYLSSLIKKDKEEKISSIHKNHSTIEEIDVQFDDNMKELQNIFTKLDKNRKIPVSNIFEVGRIVNNFTDIFGKFIYSWKQNIITD